jgi:hypothetical protein
MIVRFSLASALAAALALTGAVAPAAARNPPMAYVNPRGGAVSDTQTGWDVHDKTHIKTRLKALREEAISVQKADGGKLSDAHRVDLEQRLAILRGEACHQGLAGC